MPETAVDERTATLPWIAVYRHLEDYWTRTGRALTDSNRQAFANAAAAQTRLGVTDAELDTYRHANWDRLEQLAAQQA